MEVKTQIKSRCNKRIKKKVKKSVEQFKWGKIDLVDVVPEETNGHLPLIFAPGWSITINAIEDTLTYLADCHYRVISLNHKRIGGAKRKSEEERKAISILAILNRKDIERVDAVGYSEGCANILLAAHMQPEKFRHIVLMNPSGLTGRESKWHLIKGFVSDLRDLRSKKDGRTKRCRVLRETTKYILANPIRAYKEVSEVANTNLLDLLKAIKDTNIKVSIIHSIDDKTFDFNVVQETLKSAEKGIHIDEFYAVNGRHFDLIKFPRKYMDYVAHALHNFDKDDVNISLTQCECK